VVLDDASNGDWDPDHTEDCELAEQHDGKMDQYVTGTPCSSPKNFAYADATTMQPYWTLAQGGAIADRYFQPSAGQSSSNDMFLQTAKYVFKDNTATLKIENPGKNVLLMTVTITVGEEQVYHSGYLKPGQYILTDTLDAPLDPGSYQGTAVFEGFDPETEESKGAIDVNIRLSVE
jgi:hypothetical protein